MEKGKVRIIHNQKVSMTDREFEDYKSIAQSYNRPNFKGEDLFQGLYHTDDDGLITHIGVPSGVQTSMEVFFFISALYQHQNVRRWEERINEVVLKAEQATASCRESGKIA